MAEDLVELGLEGFDRLIDKYHDKAYDTATDGAGKVWKKVRLPGRRKSVYVEQNPEQGEKPEMYDPAKDRTPAGFKPDQTSPEPGQSSPRDDRSRGYGDYGYDRARGDDRRGPTANNERDLFGGDNLDSPRKPYPNEMPRDSNVGYPQPPPQGNYYPPPPRTAMNDYGPPSRANYNPNQYLAPAAAGAMVSGYQQPQYPRENRPLSQDESPDRLRKQRSYDGRATRRDYDSESDITPPRRRRRPRSEAPRNRKEPKDKDHSLAAGLAGALAGGLLGRQLGKGDIVTTAAGAVVGALGGDMFAEGRSKSKRDKREKDYDRKDRGRDYDRKDRGNDYDRKEPDGGDYTYKYRY